MQRHELEKRDHEAALREWKFVNFLAAGTVIEIVLLLIMRLILAIYGSPIHPPFAVAVIVLIGAFFLFWFWVRMVVDFVRNRHELSAGWGWALFLTAFFGALAYFVIVWRPRHQHGS